MLLRGIASHGKQWGLPSCNDSLRLLTVGVGMRPMRSIWVRMQAMEVSIAIAATYYGYVVVIFGYSGPSKNAIPPLGEIAILGVPEDRPFGKFPILVGSLSYSGRRIFLFWSGEVPILVEDFPILVDARIRTRIGADPLGT